MAEYALLGHNIDYSASPKIHKAFYDAHNIEADYNLISVSAAELENAIFQLKKLDGFNVTKPHKQNIIPFLEKDYSQIGSVNTVKVVGGKMYGYNTDGFGFIYDFMSQIKAANLQNSIKSCLILGAGGSAVSVAHELKNQGFELYIYNRTLSKAQEICNAEKIEPYILGGKVSPDAIINCTTLGLNGENPLIEGISAKNLKFAYDLIYNPKQTPFLALASALKAKTGNGAKMLVYQALRANEIFFDIKLGDYETEYNKIMDRIGSI